jgi:DNA-binding NarL/FixJ family response regulator
MNQQTSRHQPRRLSPEQIARIQRCEGSLRRVAKELGIGKSTVDYHRQKVYREWDAAEVSDDQTEVATIEFSRLATPKRCPTHGLVHVWPCVICSSKHRQYE